MDTAWMHDLMLVWGWLCFCSLPVERNIRTAASWPALPIAAYDKSSH